MRVNIYGEELTNRVELISKKVDGYTFYGLRFYLKFPNQPWWIHRKVDGEEDDDSTAITVWAQSKVNLRDWLDHAIAVLDYGEEEEQ